MQRSAGNPKRKIVGGVPVPLFHRVSSTRCAPRTRSLRTTLATTAVAFGMLTLAPIPDSEARAATYHLVITDRHFFPRQIEGRLNQPIKIVIRNRGTKTHNFVLPAFYIFSPNLPSTEGTSVEFTPDKQGVFPFYSDTGGVKEPGLSGEMIVR